MTTNTHPSLARVAALFVAFMLLARGLAAQGEASAEDLRLKPPAIRSDPSVTYPESAAGNETVILELQIGKDGTVGKVVVVDGTEPFAGAAAAAAQSWVFEPATRNGVPVSARIRFEVDFLEPTAEPEPESAPAEVVATEEPEPRGPPPPRSDIEVTVVGERPAAGRRSLARAEARQLPGAFGDPLRAIEVLPGVTPIASGLPYFFIRGAPPGNVGYFLDGVRVPALYHLALGPSVINPGIIERVDLHPGGYPAPFGRFAGGIVAAETTEPRIDFHGEGSVRIIDTGGFVESGFADGRGTALVGGRYSYTGLVLSLVSPDIELKYWDYQGRVTYDVGPNTTLGVFGFGSFDFLGEVEDGRTTTAFSTEFHRLDLRLRHYLSPRTRFDVAATIGVDRTDLGSDDVASADRIVGTRGQIQHTINERSRFRAGYDVTFDFFDLERAESEEEEVDVTVLFPSRQDAAFGVWADYEIDVDPRVTLTPGVRADLFTSEGESAVGVDPRIAAVFAMRDNVRLIHTLGLAHQPPSYLIPLPGLVPSGLEDGLQRSVQSSAGVEWELPKQYTLSVTGFQAAFFNLTDNLDPADFNEDEDEDVGEQESEQDESEGPTTEKLQRRSQGSAVGVEVGLRRPLTKHLGGFLSYTLSRSLRSFERSKFPSNFDRTHVLNLALGYDLGKNWRAGSRVVLYSGAPSTRRNPDGTRPRHPQRLPPFFRLDVRLEKRWKLGKRGYWAFVLEILNASLSREANSDTCEDQECRVEKFGPVTIPTVGVEAFF